MNNEEDARYHALELALRAGQRGAVRRARIYYEFMRGDHKYNAAKKAAQGTPILELDPNDPRQYMRSIRPS